MTNYVIKKVSWDQVVELSEKIAQKILSKEIDVLIPVLRGGMPLALLLSNYIISTEFSCVHIRRSISNCPNSDFGDPIFKGITNAQAITNKNVLICEDIIDKGKSLDLVLHIIQQYKPASITIATLFNFNKDKYKNVVSGETIDEYCWILFPWEKEND